MIPVTFIWIMLSLIAVGMPIVFALGAAPMIGLILEQRFLFGNYCSKALHWN